MRNIEFRSVVCEELFLNTSVSDSYTSDHEIVFPLSHPGSFIDSRIITLAHSICLLSSSDFNSFYYMNTSLFVYIQNGNFQSINVDNYFFAKKFRVFSVFCDKSKHFVLFILVNISGNPLTLLLFDSYPKLKTDLKTTIDNFIAFLYIHDVVLLPENMITMKLPEQNSCRNDCALYSIEYLSKFLNDLPKDNEDLKLYADKTSWFEELELYSRRNMAAFMWYLSENYDSLKTNK